MDTPECLKIQKEYMNNLDTVLFLSDSENLSININYIYGKYLYTHTHEFIIFIFFSNYYIFK